MRLFEQIEWLQSQIKHMEKSLPLAMAENKVTPDHAEKKLACANATLQTLISLRTITRGMAIGSDEVKP